MDTLQSWLAIATLTLTIIVIVLFGAVVFARTYRKAYGYYFALTMLGITLWSVGDLLLLFAHDPQLLRLGAELFYISPMIIPIFIWFFAISFPENRKVGPLPWTVASVFFLGFAVSLLWNLDFFIKDIQTEGALNMPIPAMPGFALYASYFSVFFMLTYIAFYKKLRGLKAVSKTQVTYTFYGALIASVPALITNLSLPAMGQRGIIWLGPFFTLFFAGAVTIAIIRHKLFDIRPVIVRSLGYTLTIIAVATVYGFLVFGIAQLLFDLHFSLPLQIGLSASTGVAALLFQNFKSFFDRNTTKLFYQDAYDPQTLFDEYNKALVSTIDLDVLLKRTTHVIGLYLKSEYCITGVKDGSVNEYRIVGTINKVISKEGIDQIRKLTPQIHRSVIVADDVPIEYEDLKQLLQKNNIAILVRLTTNFRSSQEGLGYLALGPKKSGNSYTNQDVQVIETLANELIIALQNSLRFEEIERFNETLQQRVEDATRKLKISNEKLKLLNETKDDFIGMASHQLRTPLTSVKGYLSLVIEGDAGRINATQKKLLTQAFVSSQRMVYLIADLLNVSRLRTGKFVVERAPTNIATMINDELEQLREVAAARGVELTYQTPENFPVLPLDETKTRQVIMNFMDNAIYYTPSGGHVRVELVDLPKSIELRVIDDGIGVPKHEHQHLFTKFYRAKNAQRARPDGTGLGLFMAKKVIVAQGGATIFSSKEGEGSTFGFSFPKDLPSESVAVPALTVE